MEIVTVTLKTRREAREFARQRGLRVVKGALGWCATNDPALRSPTRPRRRLQPVPA